MSWVSLLTNPEAIGWLFSSPPVLSNVQLFEIRYYDGPGLDLRLNLNEFPANPPEKWRTVNANRVQIQLMCIGVRQVEQVGWSNQNSVDIAISKGPELLHLEVRGETIKVSCRLEFLYLKKISAYCQAE